MILMFNLEILTFHPKLSFTTTAPGKLATWLLVEESSGKQQLL